MKQSTRLHQSHAKFPELALHMADPPSELYAKGNIDLLNEQPAIAIVGSRAMTTYGERACQELVKDLVSAGIIIVSGLATGIDGTAHRTALEYGGQTIAVVAHGLSPAVLYPADHAALAERITREGLIVSEYDHSAPARRHQFVARNRIIAGLTIATVVVEARSKSGALSTARFAMEYGRDVFAIPGSIFNTRSRGTHRLLKQGAILAESGADILAELNLAPDAYSTVIKQTHQNLTDTHQKIINYLETANWQAEQLSLEVGLKPHDLATNLTELEIKGIVRRNIDYSYSLT